LVVVVVAPMGKLGTGNLGICTTKEREEKRKKT
jgi:hypothetical protein